MLRSQSISNLSDSRKKGFLSSFRSRKSSSSSLNIASISGPTGEVRPLSLLMSTISLNRHVSENKENVNPASEKSSKSSRLQRPASVLYSNTSRTIKTRLSTPNLKRSSAYFGSINPPSNRESVVILPDTLSDKLDEHLIEDGQSPYTPDAVLVTDTIADSSTISIPDETLDLSSRKLHRTTNYYGISDFVLLMLHDHVDSDAQTSYLPINNRKSLEVERLEQDKIRRSLQMSLQRECKEWDSNLRLVENALFVSISSVNSCEFMDRLDDIDYTALLKDEQYTEEINDLCM